MTVLILADERDPQADYMVGTLSERGVALCRIDTAWFPAQLSVTATLRGGQWCGRLTTPAHAVDLEAVTAVWFRSPTAYQFPAQWSSTERRHSANEAKFGLGGVLMSLPALWVNHPTRIAEAGYKPLQLTTAAQVGMSVPGTLVTNDAHEVRAFAMTAPDGLIAKTFGAPTIVEQGTRKVAFTRRVSDDGLADLAGVEHTAHQFQCWLPKAYDVRVVAVGGRLFAVAIRADSRDGHLDFRRDYDACRYDLVDLPPGLAGMIARLMKHFGLIYGALDFVVDVDGTWWFLEINPGGQFGWLEKATGAPITAALADLLATTEDVR